MMENNLQHIINLFDEYENVKYKIEMRIENLVAMVQYIDASDDYFHDFESSIGLPDNSEHLVEFVMFGGNVITEWEYIDGYEPIADRNTTWQFPVEWLVMSEDELKEAIIEEKEKKVAKDKEIAYSRMKNEAEFYGFKLEKL